MDFIASIWYILSFGLLFAGSFFYKKSDKKMNGIVWIPVHVMAISCYHAFVAAIFSLVHVPVNLWTLGLVNALSGLGIFFLTKRKKEKQSYYFEWFDGIAFLTFVILIGLFAWKIVGKELAPHYLAADGAVHLKMAMGVVNSESVYGMFYAYLQHGILINLFKPIVSSAVYYKIFVLSDLLQLLFAWTMFYSLVRRFANDRFMKVAALIATVIYGCGYPMNSNLFGFTYMGMGITVIAYLLIIADEFLNERISKWIGVFALSLGCFGIFESYVLFMPVTFFAILLAVLWKQWKEKKLFSLDTMKVGLGIFLVPTALGLLYTYLGVFTNTGTTVGGAIANEGGIYRDLYSNFAILIPFVLFGIYNLYKEKKPHISIWVLSLLVVFMGALFVLGIQQKVSSYYFYKNYYFLWLIAFELAFVGLSYFDKKARTFCVFGFATWAVILGAFLLKVETRIYEKDELFCTTWKTEAYNDIYRFNRDAISLPHYSSQKLGLYRNALENYKTEDNVIAIASTWEDLYWFEAISNQSLDYGYHYWQNGNESFYETMNKDAEYVIVDYSAPIFLDDPEVFYQLETVYENEAGRICSLQK